MDRKPLTHTQRVILVLLLKNSSARFCGQKGRTGMGRELLAFETEHGLVIEAYQSPEHFLRARGLIEEVNSNAPGYWFRLTEDGRRRAEGIKQ